MRLFPSFCIAAVLSLAAVSPVARAAAPLPDPCKVMSQQEASALFGAPLDPGRGMTVACAFFGPNQDDKEGLIVTVVTSASMGAAMPMATMYKALTEKKPGDVVESVAGLGEQAQMTTTKDSDGTTYSLQVLFHDKILGIAATASPNANIKEAMKQKLKELAGRV